MRNDKQRLIDIMFEIAIHMQIGSAHFETREACAEWVADQLRKCGYPTRPCGSSWGVLESIKIPVHTTEQLKTMKCPVPPEPDWNPPRTQDYCVTCGESPQSGNHTLGNCLYIRPDPE